MNQQARILLASAISMGLVVAYSQYTASTAPPVEQSASVKAEAESKKTESSSASDRGRESASPTPSGTAQTIALENDVLTLHLENNPGGLVRSLALTDEQFRHQQAPQGLDFLNLGSAGTLEFRFTGEGRNADVPRIYAEVLEKSPTKIRLRRADARVEVIETFAMVEGYQASYDVVVKNLTDQPITYQPQIALRLGIDEDKLSQYDASRGVSWGEEEGIEATDWSDTDDEDVVHKGPLRWFGVDTKYFLAAVVGQEKLKSAVVLRTQNEQGKWLVNQGTGSAVDLAAGNSTTHHYGVFLGPKLVEALESFTVVEDAQLGQAQDWGFFGVLSKVLGKGLLWLLRFFYELTGMWGLAIILLTVAVKTVTLPLTLKQFASMRKMREMQPELTALRERYGDDKMKLNQEMQALFARTGVNPLAGCLPMLVQLPIWFALYSMIGAAVELYNQPFLWLDDLSQADPYYILPVVAGAMSWVQMHMQPTQGDPQQQAVMKWMFPGMFLFMTLVLPSGLGVYMVANSGLSLIQSYVQLRPTTKAAAGRT